MAVGLACAVVADLLHLVQPRLLGWAIDTLPTPSESPPPAAPGTIPPLLWYALALIGVSLLWGGFAYVMRRAMIGTSRKIEYELQHRLFSHLMALPPATHDRLRGGDMISRLTNDLAAVRDVLGPGIMWMVQTGAFSLLAAGMMLSISPGLSLYALAPLPLLLLLTWWGSRASHRYALAAQETLAELSNQATTAFGGIRVVKAFQREPAERDAFAERDGEYLRANLAQARVRALFFPAMIALPGVALAAVLWQGTRLVNAELVTRGEVAAFLAYVTMLIRPMMMLGWTIAMHQRGAAALGRLKEVLGEPVEDTAGTVPAPEPLQGALEFRGATVRYGADAAGADDAAPPALDDLSLEVAPGTFLAVVGPIGSGKSSLLLTLPRLLEPPRGTVRIDGVDVRDWPLAELRKQVGLVPQLPFLFSATVRTNIAAGLAGEAGEVSDADIAAAAAAAGLDPDLAAWPDGLDTRVGERGVAVSGGQRQRIAIARALLADPPILLLDDCLSSLDAETAESILAKLRAARQGRPRTTLLATHRIAEAARCDEVAVLERGRVVQRGNHAELAATPGLYQRLAERQRLEAEISGEAG
jgi:ATP-binding cassette subfamily B protein